MVEAKLKLYLTEDELGKSRIAPFLFFMMSRVALRKSDVLFWIKDSEKAKRPIGLKTVKK